MSGYVEKIEEKALGNSYFREVVFTGKYCQLVLMSLKPGEEIGSEVHKKVDQFFRIEKGRAKVIIDGIDSLVIDGAGIIVPAAVSYTHLRAHETDSYLVCRLLLEK